MANQTQNGYAQNVWKAVEWAHLPGNRVPTVTLPDSTTAEAVASLAYAWDATSSSFVKLAVDHGTGALLVADATVKTLKSASFSLSATGTVITAVATKRLKVYAIKLVVSAAISVNFRDGASTGLEGAQAIAANGGYIESVNPPAFLFGTTAGNSLDLVISGTGTAAGRVSYWDDDTT